MTNEDLKNLKNRLKNQKPVKTAKPELQQCKYCGAKIACNKCPQCGGYQRKRRSIFFLIVGLPLAIFGGYCTYYCARHSYNFAIPLICAMIGLLSFGLYFTAPEN